ncbi:MAG: HEAT repeat domain-containing protein [Anaerolineae bacterium]|nr:HEAT repeat domain-containing protein [Anaerolineae bacterium]
MTSGITLGRKPTLGEALDYYARDDFAHLMLDTCRARPVVLVIPSKAHWEPDWSRNEVKALDGTQLKAFLLEKLAEQMPDVALDERPPFYPSFHQAVWAHSPDGDQQPDCVFEADSTTWRDAFGDVRPVLDLMDEHGVYYRHKFSGHRSLHVTIPGAVLPRGYRGKGTARLAGKLLNWSRSQAHRLSKITRMPYSLNEDTGLVCLPIAHGELAAFRPWQANLHLVEVRDIWCDDELVEADIDALVRALDANEQVVDRKAVFAVDLRKIVARHRARMQSLRGAGPIGAAWQQLAGEKTLPEQSLLEGLNSVEPDVQWLIAEAYLFHGTALSERGFLALLAQNEEYVQAAAIDILIRFENAIFPFLMQMIEQLERLPDRALKAAYLLTQSDSLRDHVLAALIQDAECSRDVLVVSACLLGSLIGNWSVAFDMLAKMREAQDLTARDRARLAALDLMRTLGGWSKQEEIFKVQRLVELGPAITDLLLFAVGSPDRRFRRGIVAALAELADPRAIHLLIHALGDDYTEVRRKAIAGLIHIGKPAVDALIEAAASDQVRIRRYAIHCLGSIDASRCDTARCKRAAIEALDDAEEVVRRQAVRALQKTASVEDIEPLQAFLRRALPDSAVNAVEVLASLGEVGIRAIREMAQREHNLAAAYLVAKQGEDWGREILAEALSDDLRRGAAVEFLRELRDRRCVPFLVERLRVATDWDGAFVGRELGYIGGDEAVGALIEALSKEQAMIRRAVICGLGEARDPAAIAPLIECIVRDDDSKARKLAAEALLRIGAPAVEPMRCALAENRTLGRHRQLLIREVLFKLGADA